MKKLIIILLIFNSCFLIFSKELKEILTQRYWFYFIPDDYKDGYYELQFKNDNSFNISIIDRESESKEIGIYQIDEKKVILTLNNPFGIFKDKKQEFILHSYESLKFVYYLVGNNNIDFHNDSFTLKKDDVVNIKLSTGNYKVLILDKTDYLTTVNLNMRAEPSILSKKVYKVSAENVFNRKSIIENKNPLPKGTICKVIGRTVDKYKVNDIEHYWYLIDVFPSDIGNNDNGFVKEDVKNKNDSNSMVSNAWLFGAYLNKK